ELLAEIWSGLLGVERVGRQDNFFELGGDSIISIQIVNRLRRAGYTLRPRAIFEHQVLSELAQVLKREEQQIISEQGRLNGAAGLSPIQHHFFEQSFDQPSHYNQAVLLTLDDSVSLYHLEQAVTLLMNQHDALRFTYSHKEGQWRQFYGQEIGRLQVEDLTTVPETSFASTLQATCRNYQEEFELEEGLLVRWVFLQTPGTSPGNLLFICAHHLLIDGISWQILLDDLDNCLQSLSKAEAVDFGGKRSSYRQWQNALVQQAQKEMILQNLTYWQSIHKSHQVLSIKERPISPQPIANFELIEYSLDASLTDLLLTSTNKAYHTEINDLLLTALCLALNEVLGWKKNLIGLEGHGRDRLADQMDVSRTVGWFTALYPVQLTVEDHPSYGEVIKSIKEQLRGQPDGITYGLLRHLHQDPQVRQSLSGVQPWEVEFNYLGQWQALEKQYTWLKATDNKAGIFYTKDLVGAGNRTHTKIALDCLVNKGQLQGYWSFAKAQFDPATIQQLSRSFQRHLKGIIEYGQTKTFTDFTPSDFQLQGIISPSALSSFHQNIHQSLGTSLQLKALYPLSPLQEGMLFHSEYNEDSDVYIAQLVCELEDLNIGHFEAAWKAVFQQHSILRTGFYYKAFKLPLQAVFQQIELPITRWDHRHLPPTEQKEALADWLKADRAKGIALDHPPLMRIAFFQLAERHYQMVWTFHHLLIDGWSIPVLMNELLGYYESLEQERPLEHKAEDQYEPYIRLIQKQDTAKQEAFWRDYLDSVNQPSLLPFVDQSTERNKGNAQNKKKSIRLDADFTNALKKLARQEHLTTNTLFQGVWAYLLSRYTGNTSVLYGVTISGRENNLRDITERVGLYINTIPLCTQLAPHQDLRTWLQRLQSDQLKARDHQYIGLNAIKKIGGWSDEFFDSIMVFGNYPVDRSASQKYRLQPKKVRLEESRNYLFSIIIHLEEELDILFDYDGSQLSNQVVAMIAGHFEQVLRHLVTSDWETIGDLELLSAQEQSQMLEVFNRKKDLPEQTTVMDLFAQQVAIQGHYPALHFAGQELSYQALDQRASVLAHQLQARGIGRQQLVGIAIERSLEMIISVMGVLKTGAAYVPLDPNYPKDRLAFMMADSSVTCILCTDQTRENLPAHPTIELVNIKTLANTKSSTPYPLKQAKTTDPAYVIYTSGSTGRPKGVIVEHKGLLNLSLRQIKAFQLSAGQKVLQFASLNFDASCSELFTTLLSGGVLIIPTDEELLSPDLLSRLLSFHRINVATLPPSYQLTMEAELHHLHTLISAGEALNADLTKRLQNKGIRVINAYGPTENTVCISLTDQPLKEDGTVSIGAPLENVEVLILDEHQRICPVGVSGECCVGGVQIARGYLNRPALNDRRFIPHPLKPNQRMYRTGDRAYWLPNGELVFLGRVDDQVKIRGFRVELEEVAHQLRSHPGVKDAAVLVAENAVGQNTLYAFVITENQSLAVTALLDYLAAQLPDYMIPSQCTMVDHFPLTANGKVDKKALLDQSQPRAMSEHYVAPRTDLERQLLQAWEELLGEEKIGIYDNFFDLGGDSLLAVRMASFIQKDLSINLSIEVLFKFTCIADLADYLEILRGQDEVKNDPEQFEIIEM
ncbi:MAG: amino acid adenylation domain-containing protein, partial [Bacteroidota bacterium]